MQFGIALASETDSWRWVARAEELGFHSAWFYDTQLLNPDVFVCMALAAHHTERIRLGTGVLVPSNRIEPVTANALASRPGVTTLPASSRVARPHPIPPSIPANSPRGPSSARNC